MSLTELKENIEPTKEDLLHQRVRELLKGEIHKKNLTRDEKISQLMDMNDLLMKLNEQGVELSILMNGQKYLVHEVVKKYIEVIMKKRDDLQKELFDSDKFKELQKLNGMVINNLRGIKLIPSYIEIYKIKNDEVMAAAYESRYLDVKQELNLLIKDRDKLITETKVSNK